MRPSGRPIRVLLTNDDGVDARGLQMLRTALLETGARVDVVAPVRNMSARGHSLTLEAVTVEVIAPDMLAVDGTPADCVRIGLLCGLIERPDIVVSGANDGANVAEDVSYSGTVSAAAEAARLGVGALAVSQDSDGQQRSFLPRPCIEFPDLAYAAELALSIAQAPRGTPGHLISLNLPANRMARPARPAPIGRRAWHQARGAVVASDKGRHVVDQWAHPPLAVREPGTDVELLGDGEATLSALSVVGGLHDVTALQADELRRLAFAP